MFRRLLASTFPFQSCGGNNKSQPQRGATLVHRYGVVRLQSPTQDLQDVWFPRDLQLSTHFTHAAMATVPESCHMRPAKPCSRPVHASLLLNTCSHRSPAEFKQVNILTLSVDATPVFSSQYTRRGREQLIPGKNLQ